MNRLKKIPAILAATAALLILGVATDTAEARRGFRYRAAPSVHYVNPRVGGRYGRVYRGPVRYNTGYRGYNRGFRGYGGYGPYGGVTVGGPGFGVSVGF